MLLLELKTEMYFGVCDASMALAKSWESVSDLTTEVVRTLDCCIVASIPDEWQWPCLAAKR